MELTLLYALALDLLIGDPQNMPHPVRWIGALIEKGDALLYNIALEKKKAGIILTVFVVLSSYTITYLILEIALLIHPILSFVLSVCIVFTTLSINSLYKESMKVYHALQKERKKGETVYYADAEEEPEEDLKEARHALSMIVGRDTGALNRSEISRGAVETIAENIVDGILSPIFFALIGGAPLAIAYKAANTLDSMVGYKNERYEEFGWASARFDDLLNYIPARISYPLIVMASFISRKNWTNAIQITRRDGRKNPSPNAGIPEAAVAGALGVRLGGENYYKGIRSTKSFIGEPGNHPKPDHIIQANFIMIITALLALVFSIIILRIIP